MSTMKADIPLCFAALSVYAYTIPTSATGTPEIHIFEPLRMNPSSASCAVVFMDATSDPVFASVMAKQPTFRSDQFGNVLFPLFLSSKIEKNGLDGVHLKVELEGPMKKDDCQAGDPAYVAASTDYGLDYASIRAQRQDLGCAFHPEKSHTVGLRLLRNFVAIVEYSVK